MYTDHIGLTDGAQVWSISASGEVFVTYEEYIKRSVISSGVTVETKSLTIPRYEYLRQKKFTDAVNGKSGLTFFQALLSEVRC